MSRFAPTTLADLMGESGMDAAAERLRWMILTWDLGTPNAPKGRYYRYYVTLDCFLSAYGNRSRAAFDITVSDKQPLRGRRSKFAYRSESALQDALDATEDYLGAGLAMVCRPLAVDLSSMAGEPLVSGFAATMGATLAPGASSRMEAEDAGDLLMELGMESPTGREVLAEINRVRRDSRKTHMDPGCIKAFDGWNPINLWLGC